MDNQKFLYLSKQNVETVGMPMRGVITTLEKMFKVKGVSKMERSPKSENHPQVLYLSKQDVEAVEMPMHEVIAALEKMFKVKGTGKTEMPPKPGIHPLPDAFIHAMPAYIPELAAGIKWVSGYPQNPSKGLPYITGLLILNDQKTGIPLCVMDCTWITTMRTGAATAVAAKYLARPDSRRVGIFACGVQGRSNLEAICSLFDIEEVKAYDIHREAAEHYADQMKEKFKLKIDVVDNPVDVVSGMDIVITSGPILKHPKPVIEAGWLEPGAFASLVDFDSSWQGAALSEADKVATDDIDQINYYRREGYFQETPRPYADLGEIAAGLKHGRQTDRERTISINLGIALSDMAVAINIYNAAKQKGLGKMLPL